MAEKIVKFLTSGSVDDGKSTLIGNLLYDTDSIYDDQIEEVKKLSDGNIDYSLFVEGLESERRQKITIDVAYRYFTKGDTKFIIADSPGHEEYTRNMAVAASNSEVAILLVDAKGGIKTQTLRHLYIAHLFGIRNFVIVVNKMDLINYDQERFNEIRHDFVNKAKSLNLEDLYFIPVSAIGGDNVVKSSDNIAWYKGDTLFEYLSKIKNQKSDNGIFRFATQIVSKHNNERYYQGIVSAGSVEIGDELEIFPTQNIAKVKKIIHSAKEVKNAEAGQSVSIVLDKDLDIDRGSIFSKKSETKPDFSDKFTANIIWFAKQEFSENNNYDLAIKLNHNFVNSSINKINHLININDFSAYEYKHIRQNQIANIEIELDRRIAFDQFKNNKNTGSFLLIDKNSNETLAAGLIDKSSSSQVKNKSSQDEFISELSDLVKKHFGQDGLALFINKLGSKHEYI